MKSLKTILGIALSLGGLGATAAVVGVSAAQEKMAVQETKAVNNGRFSVLIKSDCWWKNDSASIWATYNELGLTHITADSDLGAVSYGYSWLDFGSDNYGVLSMEVDTSTFTYGNFYFSRRNPAGDTEWNKFSDNNGWVLSPAMVKNGTCNTVRIYMNGNTPTCAQDWGNYWKITTYSGQLSYTNLSSATKAAYLKSADYAFYPDAESGPTGYDFVGWYTTPNFASGTEWTSSSKPTADTTLYAKYSETTVNFVSENETVGDALNYEPANNQYSGIKTFTAGEKFKIKKVFNGTTTYHAALESGVPSSVATSNGTLVTVISAGTYSIYFKKDSEEMWIAKSSASDEAYMYSNFFNSNIGCDSTGKDEPSGWSTVKTRYETTLSNDAKDFIYEFNIESAAADNTIRIMLERYNQALKSHPSLERFITNGSGTPRGSAHLDTINNNNSNTAIFVVVIGTITVSLAGAFFILRKKKEN